MYQSAFQSTMVMQRKKSRGAWTLVSLQLETSGYCWSMRPPFILKGKRWFYIFFLIIHLPSFSWHPYTLCREMVKSYYLISLYAYHLIYTSQDILKAFKRLILFEDKKLFRETVIPTTKNSTQYQSKKTWLGTWMMTRHILNMVSQMGTMGGRKQKRKPQGADTY